MTSSTCESHPRSATNFLPHNTGRPRRTKCSKTNLDPATSPASARPPTASSRPRTTPRPRSPSARSTRTAATPARTRPTPSAASSAPWARATTPSTAWRSVTVSSRAFGAPAGKRWVEKRGFHQKNGTYKSPEQKVRRRKKRKEEENHAGDVTRRLNEAELTRFFAGNALSSFGANGFGDSVALLAAYQWEAFI